MTKLIIVLSLAIAALATASPQSEQQAFEQMLKARGWACDTRACYAPGTNMYKRITKQANRKPAVVSIAKAGK